MLNRIKKADDVHHGKWNGLGGKFERGETPEQCVIREVREESGFEISKPRLCGFLTFPDFKDEEDWYVYVFTADQFEGTLIESDEGELSWIENGNILDLPLWEGDHYFLKWIEERKFFSAKFVYRDKKLISHEVIFYLAS